ncbi:MAG: hypothetical protein AB7K71_34215 [Polyangiaceae bacterium]
MYFLRFAKVGLLLCLTYGLLAALISAYTVPKDLFIASIGVWLAIFALGTWRFVALGYAAQKRNRKSQGGRLAFVDGAIFNLIGIVGAGPFGAALIVGSLNQPPEVALKGLVFGLLGLVGAGLCYVDLRLADASNE